MSKGSTHKQGVNTASAHREGNPRPDSEGKPRPRRTPFSESRDAPDPSLSARRFDPTSARNLGEEGDLDEREGPPMRSKSHPAHDMGFIVPTSDDEIRLHPHHPNDAASVGFEVDPEAADAAADLAGDLGAQFLEGATYADDLSARALDDAEASETDVPFLVEENAIADDAVLAEVEPSPSAPARPSNGQPPRRGSGRRRHSV